MKVANLIDITPEEIVELEELGYARMNIDIATGRVELVKQGDCGNGCIKQRDCHCGCVRPEDYEMFDGYARFEGEEGENYSSLKETIEEILADYGVI